MITLGSGWNLIGKTFDNVANAFEGDDRFEISNTAAQVVLLHARDLVPVLTGALRESLEISRDTDDNALVGTEIDYAESVEFGTSRMAAQPYLRPASEDYVTEIEDATGKVVKAKLEKLSHG